MPYSVWLYALAGGALIGLAATALLLVNGRLFGVSGILAGAVMPKRGDTLWRIALISGLVAGGMLLMWSDFPAFDAEAPRTLPILAVAGLLVGLGTRIGSGCTSGHGVCGISRMSRRSLVATLVFMAAGIATVTLLRVLGGAS